LGGGARNAGKCAKGLLFYICKALPKIDDLRAKALVARWGKINGVIREGVDKYGSGVMNLM
jgi:hypothetical protein